MRKRALSLAVVLLGAYAAAVHFAMMRAIPDPFLQPDSGGFLRPAFSLLYNGTFDLEYVRTIGYPLFLYLNLALWPSLTGVLVVQHALALLTAAGAALLYDRIFDRNFARSGIVFFLVALLPRGLVYAHSIMSETPYCFLLMAALLIFFQAVQRDRAWIWLLLGLVLFAAMALRPVGIAIVGAMTLMLPFYFRRKRLARALFLLLIGMGSLTAVVQWQRPERAAALRELSALQLFGMSARWLERDRIDDPAARAALAPFFEADPAKFSDANWVRGTLYGALQKTPGLQRPMTATLRRLAWIAVSRHPWKFLRAQAETAALFIGTYSRRPPYLYPKELTFGRGLEFYFSLAKEFPKAARLLRFRPGEGRLYFDNIQRTALYPYEPGGFLSTPVFPWAYAIGYVPPLALIAAALLLWKGVQRGPVLLMLAIIFFHVLLNGLINGGDGRFALPVEPLYIVLVFGALSTFLAKKKRLNQAEPRQ